MTTLYSDCIDRVAEQAPLGGLERWLADPRVNEVMVNGDGTVWIERNGHLELVGRMRAGVVLGAIEHILTPIGRRLDRTHPTVDARLPDGSRVCAVAEPIAVDGPTLTIRRFPAEHIPITAFAPPAIIEVLRQVVNQRCNVVVSGGTSSGKTTLLNAMVAEIRDHARLITLEDVAELRLTHPHVVRLETRDATPDGIGEVTLAHLVRTALRMRPDRLIVGEVRGSEAVHLLHALNTGHDGSLATVHANSAAHALHRLAALVVHEVNNWPMSAVHRHIEGAIDVVVHLERRPDGSRVVAEVAEVIESSPPSDASGLSVRHIAINDRVVGSLQRGRR